MIYKSPKSPHSRAANSAPPAGSNRFRKPKTFPNFLFKQTQRDSGSNIVLWSWDENNGDFHLIWNLADSRLDLELQNRFAILLGNDHRQILIARVKWRQTHHRWMLGPGSMPAQLQECIKRQGLAVFDVERRRN